MEGDLFHERAHDEQQAGKAGDTLILRGLSVFSASLGPFRGKLRLLRNFTETAGRFSNRGGKVFGSLSVEYKRGAPKAGEETRLQLCAPGHVPGGNALLLCFGGRTLHARPGGGFRWSSRRSCESRYGTSRRNASVFSAGYTPKGKARQTLQRLFL